VYSYGYLDRLIVSGSRCKHWEDSFLAGLVSREGWVVSNDARGPGAWNDNNTNQAVGGLGALFSRLAQQQPQQQQQPLAGTSNPGDPRPGRAIHTPSNNNTTTLNTAGGAAESTSFPTGGGRALGTSRRPGAVDPRQARLQAIERRSGVAKNSEEQV
jgi:hypothetical protein